MLEVRVGIGGGVWSKPDYIGKKNADNHSKNLYHIIIRV